MKTTTLRHLIAAGLLLFLLYGGIELVRNARSSDVLAQTGSFSETDLAPIRANIRNFFENLSDVGKGPKKAFDELLKNSSISGDEKISNDMPLLIKEINSRFGNYLSFEEVGVKSIGSDLVVLRYLYKCQNHPIVFYFTYYRPSIKSAESTTGTWTLIGMRFDSNLESVVKDMGF